MIFIARNHNGKIIGIVSAKTEESVNAKDRILIVK